jgi:CRISPR-associated endonuclease/helicase Cas3
MEYLAHNENSDGKPHLLHEHLSSVGKYAESFLSEVNPALAETGRWAGLLHDLGKYRDEFQEMLRGRTGKSIETHHAVYGAALAILRKWNLIGFVIAGHHAGLHNLAKLKAFIKNPTYQIFSSEVLQNLEKLFESELEKIPLTLVNPEFIRDNLQLEFAVRMIFSALVDADRRDTAEHAEGKKFSASPQLQAGEMLEKLKQVREQKRREAGSSDRQLVEIRNQIFDDCLQKAEEEQGFFSLTVPTGGGKTLSAMAFALRHAEVHSLRRVIVVIPYLSIIEQNARQYREIFGDDVVIENHSAVEPTATENDDWDDMNPMTLITENWDAPVIVTTSVQFIESLFTNKPSRCRKLHNIARSVVIFDEVQTLPAHLLEPLFSVWRELKENYGVSFVFSTATQPAFRQQNNFRNGFDETELREITTGTAEIFKNLSRVTYDFANFSKPQSWSEIAQEMLAERQVLCVVNTRRHAFELWNALYGKLAEHEKQTLFHLSSAMCPEHRLLKIEQIRECLKNGEVCRVVSTQLVEAGVDLDFPVLFRAVAPLDSIVQAAGRCNREGKIKKGRVKVFQPEDNVLPRGIYKFATETTCSMGLDTETLAHDFNIFADYFRRIYQSVETGKQIQIDRSELNFQDTAEKAKVIENMGISVVVPFGRAPVLIEKIRMKNYSAKKLNFSRKDFRSLQRLMVNLYPYDFQILERMGQIERLIPNRNLDLFVVNEGSYHAELGVLKEERPTDEFYVL